MIGISSCLGGICCRYDGKSQEQEALKQLVTNGKAIILNNSYSLIETV